MRRFQVAILIATILAIFTSGTSKAVFFDTSKPEDLMNVGVRLGINTSNRNVNKDVFDIWNNNSWGTGVDLGVVAELNFAKWISVQPGIFFESRSGKYSYINLNGYAEDGDQVILTQFGKDRSYSFIVPVLASAHFNLFEKVRWNVEFGPYFQFVLKNTVNGEFYTPVYNSYASLPTDYVGVTSTKFDFGLKMGTSLRLFGHYLVGIHYEAGCLKPWKNANLGGRRKAWVFSVGYDF